MSAGSAAKPNRDHLVRRVRELGPWFQNFDVGGVSTAPDHFLGDYPEKKWRRFRHVVPEDLNGASVLDVGCNAGFYAQQMKRRNAGRVVAIDTDPRYLEQARIAAEINGFDIELRQLSVYDVSKIGERFDWVLFLGVLYHLRHPLLALDLLHEHVVGDRLLFQSMMRGSPEPAVVDENYSFHETAVFEDREYPKLFFVEQRYADDPTNWWIPNRACAEGMLRSSGFDVLSHPEPEVFLCRRREHEER